MIHPPLPQLRPALPRGSPSLRGDFKAAQHRFPFASHLICPGLERQERNKDIYASLQDFNCHQSNCHSVSLLIKVSLLLLEFIFFTRNFSLCSPPASPCEQTQPQNPAKSSWQCKNSLFFPPKTPPPAMWGCTPREPNSPCPGMGAGGTGPASLGGCSFGVPAVVSPRSGRLLGSLGRGAKVPTSICQHSRGVRVGGLSPSGVAGTGSGSQAPGWGY